MPDLDSPEDEAASKRMNFVPEFTINRDFLRYFIYAGLIFLLASLILFIITGYICFDLRGSSPSIDLKMDASGKPTSDSVIIFFTRAFQFYIPPIITFFTALICALIGIRLLRSSGAVSTQVISPQDYALLGPAIANGNEQAINLFIRLSSLSGATGSVTKIGLTGLPLATIILTLLLALGGLINPQFYDLAKLTLGAFLGSFVQRQAGEVGGGPGRLSATSGSPQKS